jgi:Zn-dependent protease with chaperone function
MKDLDKHLLVIQEDNISEFDPLTATAVVGTAYLISSLSFFFYSVGEISRALKVDKTLSDRMNIITGEKGRWKVHIYPDPKSPNAFALGMGRHIFVTTGLLEILSKREVEAVLIHEIHHNKNKDAYKSLAYKHSFFYLVTFLALSTAAAFSLPLGILAFILLNKAINISHALVLGRRQEIKADKYTIQFGYEKDLISAFHKIDAVVEKMYRQKPCGNWCQLERKVSEMIDEHPSTKTRVETILKTSDKLGKQSIVKLKDKIARSFK